MKVPISLLKAELSQMSMGIGVTLKALFEVPTAPRAEALCILHPGWPLPQDRGSVLIALFMLGKLYLVYRQNSHHRGIEHNIIACVY